MLTFGGMPASPAQMALTRRSRSPEPPLLTNFRLMHRSKYLKGLANLVKNGSEEW
jgi:hypothetical protein